MTFDAVLEDGTGVTVSLFRAEWLDAPHANKLVCDVARDLRAGLLPVFAAHAELRSRVVLQRAGHPRLLCRRPDPDDPGNGTVHPALSSIGEDPILSFHDGTPGELRVFHYRGGVLSAIRDDMRRMTWMLHPEARRLERISRVRDDAYHRMARPLDRPGYAPAEPPPPLPFDLAPEAALRRYGGLPGDSPDGGR